MKKLEVNEPKNLLVVDLAIVPKGEIRAALGAKVDATLRPPKRTVWTWLRELRKQYVGR